MIAALLLLVPIQAGQPTLGADEARSSIQRSAKWLLENQRPDGSWGSNALESVLEINYSPETFYALKVAAHGLACMALRAIEETPERRASLDKAMEWLCTTRLPRRGNDWDIDGAWAWLYGFIALVDAETDPRFSSEEWQRRIRARGVEFYEELAAHQEPKGGWGYYEGPVVSRRPTWSTSFSTACVIPALVEARTRGWPVDQALIDRAAKYVRQCRLPSGAYTYGLDPIPRVSGGESINDVKGSLSRIQVCHLALRRAGDRTVTDERIREGLEAFFREHKFLDVARMKPIPHEAYYANAGYFYYFGHLYAGLLINELPEAEREGFHARLRPHLVKAQWKDGSSMDTQGSGYFLVAGTSFSLLALQAGLSR